MKGTALLIAVLLGSASVQALNNQAPLARVIDSPSERIPAFTVAPEYPRKARRDRIEGEVQVCFDIDREGRPRRVAVRHSTNRAFEKPSVKAVKESSFRPLGQHDVLPTIKSCRTFVFSLVPVEEAVAEAE